MADSRRRGTFTMIQHTFEEVYHSCCGLCCGEGSDTLFTRIFEFCSFPFLCCGAGESQLSVPVQETSPASFIESSVQPCF